MKTLLLLLAFAGQIPANGGDNRPTADPGYAWHTISHEGLEFRVWGRQEPGTDDVYWDRRLAVNWDAWKAARLAAERARVAPARSLPPEMSRHGIPNYGIGSQWRFDVARLQTEVYRWGGGDAAKRYVEKVQAHAAPAPKLHLSVIGRHEDCEPVLKDLRSNPLLSKYADNLFVQEYNPGIKGDWAVEGLKFRLDGKPAIYLQNRGGAVYFKTLDYSCGPEGLAKEIFSGLRRADPNYNPDSPEPAPLPSPSPLKLPESVPPYVVVGGALLGWIILLRITSRE